jgi:hypothetical protein
MAVKRVKFSAPVKFILSIFIYIKVMPYIIYYTKFTNIYGIIDILVNLAIIKRIIYHTDKRYMEKMQLDR